MCGRRGYVERLASGPYMAQNAREILANEGQVGKILGDLVGDNLELLTGQLVSEAAAAGDDLAQKILRKSAWALGVGIGNVANLVNPQLFILGGSVTKAGTQWW